MAICNLSLWISTTWVNGKSVWDLQLINKPLIWFHFIKILLYCGVSKVSSFVYREPLRALGYPAEDIITIPSPR